MKSIADFSRLLAVAQADAINRQRLYLRAFAQSCDDKFGPAVTVELLRFALERAEKRLAGENNGSR